MAFSLDRSEALLERARALMPGGVNSPVRVTGCSRGDIQGSMGCGSNCHSRQRADHGAIHSVVSSLYCSQGHSRLIEKPFTGPFTASEPLGSVQDAVGSLLGLSSQAFLRVRDKK